MKTLSYYLLTALFILGLSWSSTAQTFTPGNVTVFVASASANNTTASILEFNPNTANQAATNTYVIDGTGANAMRFSGSASSTGYLANSNDGTLLSFNGANNTNTSSNVNTLNPRAVGTLSASYTFNLATTYTGTSGNQTRCATSLDNVNWYIADQGGLFTNGANAASPVANLRGIKSFGGIVYSGLQSGTVTNIQVGTVSAITGGSITGLPGLTNNSSFQDFYLVSSGLNGSAFDILYVVSATSNTVGSIAKYSLVAGTWVSNGSYTTNFGGFGLSAKFTGSSAQLFVSSGQGALANNRLIKLTDASGYNTTINITTANNVDLYIATGNTLIKGVAFAPLAPPTPVVSLAVSSNTASETDETIITVSANTSSAVSGDQTIDIAVSGTGITLTDYSLSSASITILSGQTSSTVTFTILDDMDIEGQETATLEISNPSSGMNLGSPATQEIVISDDDFDNFPPSIAIGASTSNFIDGGLSGLTSPYYVSGVIGDITDPASTLGIDFMISDTETVVGSLIVTAQSSNTSVVPNLNIVIIGAGAIRTVQITPTGVGNTTITVSVFDGTQSSSFVIGYSASSGSPVIDVANTRWHTGISDASSAISIDNNYYVAADDELNHLNVYDRANSGLPLASFNYSSFLALPQPGNPEVDLEASATSPVSIDVVYWSGSMSNGKSPFDDKPNRDRLFATQITGTGSATSFLFSGYVNISPSLLTWGDANGYNFTASAQAGVDSKALDGFAMEGMVFGPDNTTLYVGFRAPLVPTANRTNAVIAPILNFETWFNNGSPSGDPVYGAPIELNLNNRGIRDIQRLSNGTYIIIAGSPSESSASDLYKWSGHASDAPILVPSAASGLINMEGLVQVNNGMNPDLTKIQVVSDGGTVVLYADGIEAKDQGELNLRKFRSDILVNLDLDICTDFTASIEAQGPTTFCDGGSVELTAISSSPADSYDWTTGATTSTISVSTSGMFTVTVSNLAGCSAIASQEVVVTAPLTWYLDADNDGYNDGSTVACENPGTGYNLTSILSGDCDDMNENTNPGVAEIGCNNIDDDCDGIVDEGKVEGCIDPMACNYNLLANCDDFSCEYVSCIDSDNDGLSDAAEIILGTDPNNADTDNDGADDGIEVNVFTSNPLVQDTDGDGLTDGSEINFTLTSPVASDSDNDGCDDLSEVTGACDVVGCTYTDAVNFDPLATSDNGTCQLTPANTCPGDLDSSGSVNSTDLLIFLTTYGTVCP